MNTLTMTFKNKLGKNFSLKIPKVKDDISENLIQELMDLILEKNVFFYDEKELLEKTSATINKQEKVF